LQVGAGAGLGHGDGADQLARGHLGQPALLLLFGAVVQDVGGDDARVQRAAKAGLTSRGLGQDQGSFVAEVATGTAVLFGHGGAQETVGTGFAPGFAVHHALGTPALVLRTPLLLEEARGRLQQHFVLVGHPGGFEVLNGHEVSSSGAAWTA